MSDQEELDDQIIGATADSLIEAVSSKSPSQDQIQRMKAALFNRVQSAPPAGSETVRNNEGQWLKVTDELEMKLLFIDKANDRQSAIWRLHPGAVIPAHKHTSTEECLVLEGELNIGDHHIYKGDYHVAFEGEQHPPLHSANGCLLLISSQIFFDPDTLPQL